MAQSTPTSAAPQRSEGIDFTTLALTAAASAAAAYTCSKLWAPGTLASATAMPVLVAIIREALQRPTQVVTRAVPVRGVVRSAQSPDADSADRVSEPEPPTRVAQPGSMGDPPSAHGRRWRLAIITGLLGFLVCAVVFTVPELVAGGSAGGGDRSTTLFGGDDEREREKRRDRERQPTTTVPGKTVTTRAKTVTAPPERKTKTAPTSTTRSRTQTMPKTTTTTTTAPPREP